MVHEKVHGYCENGCKVPVIPASDTCKPNLLLNSDFKSGIVNQKGSLNYTNTAINRTYGIDSWYITGSSDMTVNNGYLSVNLLNGDFGQNIILKKENETVLTFSIKKRSENLKKVTFDISTMNKVEDHFIIIDNQIKLGIYMFGNEDRAWLYLRGQGTHDIEFIKLECGNTFTGMPAWNYSNELLKCQRYYYRVLANEQHAIFPFLTTFRKNRNMIFIPLPTKMIKKPSMTLNGRMATVFAGADGKEYWSNWESTSNLEIVSTPDTGVYLAIKHEGQAQNRMGELWIGGGVLAFDAYIY